jgi:putative glycosyltransferase
MNKMTKPTFSIVTSLYNSSPYIEEFYARMKKAVESLTDSYEIIFVNDGSPDDSLTKAIAIQQQDSKVLVIELSRNFGQHKASITGLGYATGEYIFLIEVDLEELPEWIVDFYEKLMAENADVIYGVQEQRKGNTFERLSGELFYKIYNALSEVKIPPNHITTRLMTKQYVQALLQYRERELFIGGVYELVGFTQKPYLVTKLDHSETTYTLIKKLRLLVNAVTSFSAKPLWLIFWTGFLVSIFSFSFILYVVFQKIFWTVAPGWTSVIASIWAVGGLIMLSIGIVGIYLKKIMEEVKERPYTTIRNIYKSKKL